MLALAECWQHILYIICFMCDMCILVLCVGHAWVRQFAVQAQSDLKCKSLSY